MLLGFGLALAGIGLLGGGDAGLFLLPQLVGLDGPQLGFRHALVAVGLGRLRAGQVGALGAGLLDHHGQPAGVVQHRARSQQVLVERLVGVVLHEQRSLQGFQQRRGMDVVVGVMDEGARLDVAVGVDVQVAAAAGDAAVDVLAIVPEVHREDRLGAAIGTDLVEHLGPLVGGGDQSRHGVGADGHVGEQPGELGAHVDHPVEVALAADDVDVGRGVAA